MQIEPVTLALIGLAFIILIALSGTRRPGYYPNDQYPYGQSPFGQQYPNQYPPQRNTILTDIQGIIVALVLLGIIAIYLKT